MAKAEKGDLIRIIDKAPQVEAFEVGGIYEVVGYSAEDTEDEQVVISGIGGREWYVDHNEYVIHRKAGEEGEVVDCDMCSGDPERADCPYCATGEEAQDAVNPQHYKQGRVEVIDIIEDAVQGADPFEAVCQANIIKYSLRYRHKNGVEDLRKSVWYTEKLIAYLDAKSQLTPADVQLTE